MGRHVVYFDCLDLQQKQVGKFELTNEFGRHVLKARIGDKEFSRRYIDLGRAWLDGNELPFQEHVKQYPEDLLESPSEI